MPLLGKTEAYDYSSSCAHLSYENYIALIRSTTANRIVEGDSRVLVGRRRVGTALRAGGLKWTNKNAILGPN